MYLHFKFHGTSLSTTNTPHVLLCLTFCLTFFRWQQDGVTKKAIYTPCPRVPAPTFAVLMTIIHNKTGNMCKHKTEARARHHCSRGKARSNFTHWECMSATLAIQHAKPKRCIYVWPVWLYRTAPKYPINDTTFGGGGEKKLLSTKCVYFIFSSNFV